MTQFKLALLISALSSTSAFSALMCEERITGDAISPDAPTAFYTALAEAKAACELRAKSFYADDEKNKTAFRSFGCSYLSAESVPHYNEKNELVLGVIVTYLGKYACIGDSGSGKQ